MKRTLLTTLAVASALAPAAAQARTRPVVPPGNSGANQYVEVIPTAGGSQPTQSVHAGGVGHKGTPGPPGGSAVSSPTQRALTAQGTTGSQVAALAKATAPAGVTGLPVRTTHHRTPSGTSGAPASATASAPSAGASAAPASAIVRAVTGSGGGLGSLLPTILAVVVVWALVMTFRRRRGHAA